MTLDYWARFRDIHEEDCRVRLVNIKPNIKEKVRSDLKKKAAINQREVFN